ncbi:MAG: PQQ-like beta-propeller repeat protein [Prevotellaceae bacterium]|jgi:outer membrane protein assembly factor BamB|nr:PQQ-like beta-propeller repeat protein [Prevotellaceae bacterium]
MKQLFFLTLICITLSLSAQNTIQWRNDRTGIYHEKGLLTSWPTKGPQMLWHYDSLGEGHSSVAIDANKIYITGMTGNTGYLYVFDMAGKLLKKKDYGKEWDESYNGARGTVTISDSKLYIFTGTGFLICMDQNTLNILWKKDIVVDFGGKNIRWGVNESPLVIGEKVILSAGGKEHNIVALNKKDGSLIWTCAGNGDLSSYCSPLYIANQQVPQIATMMADHILGVDAATGKKLWSFKYANNRKIHPNTPIYHDNMLFCTSGYGKGAVMLRLTNGGRSVEKVWEVADLDPRTGAMVKIGNYIYGSGDNHKYWFCIDWKTGEIKYKDKSFGVGAVIANEDMLYCYSEKGEMALVKATPEKFDMISKFPIVLGTDQHWAHPVIYQGVLYVRHGNTLMAYKAK